MTTRRRVAALAALVLVYALPALLDAVRLRMAVEILYYGLFAVSFNILFGYAGLLSFGHAASFGVGGYTAGLALKHVAGMPLVPALVIGALAGAAAGVVIGFFCVRLRGTYFALLTLAFSQFLFAIALTWRDVTRGDDGLTVARPDITIPGLGTISMGDTANFYRLELTLVVVCLWLAWRFTRTPLGQGIVLMRENDERAAFLGYNVFATKLVAFVVSATLAGMAGALFATFQRLVSPASLDLPLSTEVVFMAILGGTSAFLGPFLGAGVYIVLQDWLSRTTENWPFFFGLLFVLVILFAHEGLTGLVSRDGLLRRFTTRRRPPAEEPA